MRNARTLTTWSMVVFWLVVAAVVVAMLVLGATVARGADLPMPEHGIADGMRLGTATEPQPDPWAGIIEQGAVLLKLVIGAAFLYVSNMLRAWLKRMGAKDNEIAAGMRIINALADGIAYVEDAVKDGLLAATREDSEAGRSISANEAAQLRNAAYQAAIRAARDDRTSAALRDFGVAAWDGVIARLYQNLPVTPEMLIAAGLVRQ